MVAEVPITLILGAVRVDEVVETSNQQVLATALGLSTIRVEVNMSCKSRIDMTKCRSLPIGSQAPRPPMMRLSPLEWITST